MAAPPVLSEDAVWAAVDRERVELADLLDGLTPEEWAHPSLCTAWRVRDVAAHLSLAHTSTRQAIIDMARAGGSFDRMVRDSALRRAEAPPGELTVRIRAMAGSRRLAPGVSHLEPLLDSLVHGQDITVPLGPSSHDAGRRGGHGRHPGVEPALAALPRLPRPRPAARLAACRDRHGVVGR